MSVQRSVALVDVAAMPDGDDEDEEHVVVELVDDSAPAPEPFFTNNPARWVVSTGVCFDEGH